MKTFRTKIFFIFSLALIASCTPYKYLEGPSTHHLSPLGSHLSVNTNTNTGDKYGTSVEGELILIDDVNLYLLTEEKETKEIRTISLTDIKKYSLRYARAKSHAWTIPVYTFFTLSHGLFLVFTFPINLIATTWIFVNANNDYRFTNKDLKIEELYKYARFPQGLPDGISLDDLK